MIFIIAILKEVRIMNNTFKPTSWLNEPRLENIIRFFFSANIFKRSGDSKDDNKILHPFRVIVNKEISDHVRSWRFVILIAIILLTCLGSMYTALSGIGKAVKPNDPEGTFFFLKLFTISDGSLPSFIAFIGFLGPLLGISMGFDAVNSEQNNRTLSRILAQPIHRDYLLNAKFLASLVVISVMFFALGFLVMGFGLVNLGIPPTVEEFLRIVLFIILSILYVAFWLNLSILFSVQFRQPATSALAGIAVWLFFTVFYSLILNFISKAFAPSEMASQYQKIGFEQLILSLSRIMPNQLFTEATTTLLMPSVRSLGPLTMEQVYGTIPGPLPLGQSVLLVWPHITGLIAGTVLCFVLSYISFMRREIRSR
jgi:ABC-2 type transport system permease protein